MRLLSLREHLGQSALFLSMWKDFLIEQKAAPQNKNQLKMALQEKLADANCELFLIENLGKIVGFAEVSLEEECFPDEDLPELCLKMAAFYIAPTFRHHSLGHQAFKLLCRWGREMKAALLETEVSRELVESNKFLLEVGLELVGHGKRNIWRGFI